MFFRKNNVYFLCDFYRGGQDRNISILYSLLNPLLKYYNIESIILKTEEHFTDEDWISSLKGLKNSCLNNYNITNEDFVIGFEINKIDLEYLNKNNIRWINFEIHPVRFLDDLYFSVTSSFKFNWHAIAMRDTDIEFYANIFKLKSSQLFIHQNSLLIVGQAFSDKSVFFDDGFKSLEYYFDRLDLITQKYNKVYYRHHPLFSNHELDEKIIQRYSAVLVNNESFYELICSDNIKCITGISSSTLYESKFFNKDVEFLEQRIKDFGKPISLQSLYSSSSLWLSLLLNEQFDMYNLNINFENNLLRNLFGSWSYKTLEQEIDSLNNRCINLDEKMNESFDRILNEANERATQAEQNAHEANERATQAEQNAHEANERATQAEQNANEAWQHYSRIEESNSWKITKPLRKLRKFIKWFFWGMYHWFTFSPTSRPRRIVKKIIKLIVLYIYSHPKLKKSLGSIIGIFPGMKRKLLSLANRISNNTNFIDVQIPNNWIFNKNVFPNDFTIPMSMIKNSNLLKKGYSFRIKGHIEGHYSLAVVNRNLSISLEKLLPNCVSISPYHGIQVDNPSDFPEEDKKVILSMIKNESNLITEEIVSIVHHYPYIIDTKHAKYKIIIFPWEETSVPYSTVLKINNDYNTVFVPSSFVKIILRNSGCNLPIFVIPNAIDHVVKYTDQIKNFINKNKIYRFLHVSSCFPRKGIDVLLKAYFTTFTSEDNVELYIKTFPNEHNTVRYDVEQEKLRNPYCPNVIIDENSLDNESMKKLYFTADAVVLPARGEGFNLPAAEAMALGLPVITTGFSGQLDFCTTNNSKLITYFFAKSQSHLRSYDACWAEPEVDNLSTIMREMYETPNSMEYINMLKENAFKIRNIYTWDNVSNSILSAVNQLDNLKIVENSYNLALFSTWNVKCGIAEYSKNLFSNFSKRFNIEVYSTNEEQLSVSKYTCFKSWKIADEVSIIRTLETIEKQNYDFVLIQHHPGFFMFNSSIIDVLYTLSNNTNLIIEFHNLESIQNYLFEDLNIQKLLINMKRIIVHRILDLNILLRCGIQSNVMLLPLGNDELYKDAKITKSMERRNLAISDNEIVLATFGFLYPHKGVKSVIESLKLFNTKMKNKKVHFLCINAVNDERSRIHLNELKLLAKNLNIENQIVWINDYLEMKKCIELLCAADYIIYPYKETEESASAAVTAGLITQNNILVSPISIFDELTDTAWKMNGNTSDNIYESVKFLEENKEEKERRIEKQNNYVFERSWNRVSSRFSNLLEGLIFDLKI